MKKTIGSKDVTTYFKLIDPATGIPETGLTITNLDATYTRNGAAAVKADLTALAAADSAHGDNKGFEVDGTNCPGLYRIDWPDAAFAVGVTQVQLCVNGAAIDPAYVEVEMVGSIHEWHVAKNGNDTTHGGHSEEDSFLTIAAAVTAAADGDMIYIWPGTYAESVDLDTANKGLHLKGMGVNFLCKIYVSNADAVTCESNTTLENLYVRALGSSGTPQSVVASSKYNINLINCWLYSQYDAFYPTGSYYFRAKDCIFQCKYDAVNLNDTHDFIFDNCIFISDGTHATDVPTSGIVATTSVGGVFNNCVFLSTKPGSTTDVVRCVYGSGVEWVFNNCTLRAYNADADDVGVVYGIHAVGGSLITLNNCVIHTVSVSAAANYDIYNNASTVVVGTCRYDTTKVFGTITNVNSGLSADVNAQADTALSDIKLDHLIAVADNDDVVNNSIIAKIVSKSATADWSGFVNTTDSFEAIRDRGDTAWITATSVTVSDKTGFKLASDGVALVTAWTCTITGNIVGTVSTVTTLTNAPSDSSGTTALVGMTEVVV